MTVGDLCVNSIVSAHPDDTVIEAARRMRARHVGDIVVTDDNSSPVGMLTDRDIVVSVVAQSPDKIETLLVRDVMTPNVVTVRRSDSIAEAIKRMRAGGIRRLPVVNARGRLDGMLAFDDVLRAMAEQFSSLAGLLSRGQAKERVRRK